MFVLFANLSCTPHSREYVSIGHVPAKPPIEARVGRVLASEGIQYSLSGSLSVTILVPAPDADRARMLVRRDAQVGGYSFGP